MDLWTRLEQARARWNVLEHPFYERWSRGELRRDELAAYSGQYRYAVVALADAAAGAAPMSRCGTTSRSRSAATPPPPRTPKRQPARAPGPATAGVASSSRW